LQALHGADHRVAATLDPTRSRNRRRSGPACPDGYPEGARPASPIRGTSAVLCRERDAGRLGYGVGVDGDAGRRTRQPVLVHVACRRSDQPTGAPQTGCGWASRRVRRIRPTSMAEGDHNASLDADAHAPSQSAGIAWTTSASIRISPSSSTLSAMWVRASVRGARPGDGVRRTWLDVASMSPTFAHIGDRRRRSVAAARIHTVSASPYLRLRNAIRSRERTLLIPDQQASANDRTAGVSALGFRPRQVDPGEPGATEPHCPLPVRENYREKRTRVAASRS